MSYKKRVRNIKRITLVDKVKRFLCDMGIHKWFHYSETIKVNIERRSWVREMTAPIRECKWCGTRQHHMMPACNGHAVNWKKCKWPKGYSEEIKFVTHNTVMLNRENTS